MLRLVARHVLSLSLASTFLVLRGLLASGIEITGVEGVNCSRNVITVGCEMEQESGRGRKEGWLVAEEGQVLDGGAERQVSLRDGLGFMPRRKLEGKVALVTGGASGLGKATALEFIQEGASVVLADVDAQLGRQAAQQLGPRAEFVECDVTVEPQVAEAVDFAVARHGRLDIMHNSAGITGPPTATDVACLDLANFDHVMGVNVRGTLAGIKHAARVMGPAGAGSIICVSSISGLMGGLGTHPYTISKFAVAGMVRSLAGDLCRRGVRINCISPFVTLTPLVVGQFTQLYGDVGRQKMEQIVDSVSELRGARSEEMDVAKAAVYLASDEAKYVSGHNLVVDGGFTSYKQLNLPMPEGMVP
ncbi:hypothetical protein GW17_00032956 [Ensete ventricosum]|nr:hypothetical protein GW17_00032956 [Ensete ventricosum]